MLKTRDITLPTMICTVKPMAFPVVMYGCESWPTKKAECQRTDTFKLWCWRRFFRVQFSHWYMTTGKTIVLTTWIFDSKVMSLLSNMQYRLVIAFLSRSKSLNFVGAVTFSSNFGAQINKICNCFHSPPPFLFSMKWWEQMLWFQFVECWVLSQFFHSPLSPSSRGSLILFPFLL